MSKRKDDDNIIVFDIKDKRNIYGRIEYDKETDNIFFINKHNLKIPLISKRKMDTSINTNGIKYLSTWNKNTDYKIHTLVKYNNDLYISKNDISSNVEPNSNDEWELIINSHNPVTKEVALFNLSEAFDYYIKRSNLPLIFNQTQECDFIEFIDANKSIYINTSGKYQVTYNITFSCGTNYITAVVYLINKGNIKQIEKGMSYITKPKTDDIVNINHSFLLEIDSIDEDNTSYTEENDGHQIVISMRFKEEAYGETIHVYQDQTWLEIYKI